MNLRELQEKMEQKAAVAEQKAREAAEKAKEEAERSAKIARDMETLKQLAAEYEDAEEETVDAGDSEQEEARDESDDSIAPAMNTRVEALRVLTAHQGKLMKPSEIAKNAPRVPIRNLWQALGRLAADPQSGVTSPGYGKYVYNPPAATGRVVASPEATKGWQSVLPSVFAEWMSPAGAMKELEKRGYKMTPKRTDKDDPKEVPANSLYGWVTAQVHHGNLVKKSRNKALYRWVGQEKRPASGATNGALMM